jgi:hypothetical protein
VTANIPLDAGTPQAIDEEGVPHGLTRSALWRARRLVEQNTVRPIGR